MTDSLDSRAALVAEELSRLLNSDALRRAPSHTRLLRYLVEHSVVGDDTALRETAIALEVFRRDPASFDPQSDPIVRVTTRRLRDRLDAHYARFDCPPRLRIVVPKGRYGADFVTAEVSAPLHGLAVMQTRNRTGDSGFDALCTVLTDRLADGLAAIGVPRIIARDSVALAEAEDPAAQHMAERLGVETLLQSSLDAGTDGQLRATARLIDTRDASVRWVETRAREVAHRFELMDSIVDRVYGRFAATLRGDGRQPGVAGRAALTADDQDALDLMSKWLREFRYDEADRMIPVVAAIAVRYTDCARAWSLLAFARFRQAHRGVGAFRPAYSDAREYAEKALAIDPEDPQALGVIGLIDTTGELKWQAASARFRGILGRYPHLTSVRANLANVLLYVGAFDEALEQLALALVHDPLSTGVRTFKANALTYSRRHDEARREWEMLRRLGAAPVPSIALAGNNELWAGDLDRAEALYVEAGQHLPDNPLALMCAAWVEALRGNRRRALAIERDCLERYPSTSAFNRAELAGHLRDKASVLAHLETARQRSDPLTLSACVDPSFEWLGADADFNRLLTSWGLPGWRGAPGPI